MIATVSEFENVRQEASNKGKSFAVAPEVFAHYARRLSITPVSDVERQRIEQLLDITITNTGAIGITRTATCPCGHAFSFADFIESSLHMGRHTKEQLSSLMQGNTFMLTVDTDEKREMVCTVCGKTFPAPHCCYVTSSYAYT
ncbi:MAG TPA: hypothetical protein VFC39_05505 [Acidobacteriaceae bacterium]|nr:hypothetical protein [Acidobacteriaceae bacterium]